MADNHITLAANLAAAWLANPSTRANAEEAAAFIEAMHRTLAGTASDERAQPSSLLADQTPSETFEPAVTVRKSLASRDKIISLIDGKPYTTLKKHLATHGLTPQQYRERYRLKPDYPMTAPAYSERRRELANKIGLGAKGRGRRPVAAASETPASAPKRGRKTLSIKG